MVAELAKRYLREGVAVRCEPPTAGGYRQVPGTHVAPVPGTPQVAAIRRAQVAELRHRSRNTPTASHPRRQVRKHRTRRLERFLAEGEFRRLGETRDTLEAVGRGSGARGGGTASVDAHRVPRRRDRPPGGGRTRTLRATGSGCPDAKTGPRAIARSRSAVRVVARVPARRRRGLAAAQRGPGWRLASTPLDTNWSAHRLKRALRSAGPVPARTGR